MIPIVWPATACSSRRLGHGISGCTVQSPTTRRTACHKRRTQSPGSAVSLSLSLGNREGRASSSAKLVRPQSTGRMSHQSPAPNYAGCFRVENELTVSTNVFAPTPTRSEDRTEQIPSTSRTAKTGSKRLRARHAETQCQ